MPLARCSPTHYLAANLNRRCVSRDVDLRGSRLVLFFRMPIFLKMFDRNSLLISEVAEIVSSACSSVGSVSFAFEDTLSVTKCPAKTSTLPAYGDELIPSII